MFIVLAFNFTQFSSHLIPVPVLSPNRGFARQPCCMVGTMKTFCITKNIFPIEKRIYCFCRATWLPCNMAAVQNLYSPSTPLGKYVTPLVDRVWLCKMPSQLTMRQVVRLKLDDAIQASKNTYFVFPWEF